MKLLLFLSVIFILSVTACEQDCYQATLHFGLVGFSETEADTIILRRFAKSGSSSHLIDTFLFKKLDFYRRADTLDISGIPSDASMKSNYNYEIVLPGAATLFSISDIIESKETLTKSIFECTKEACVNRITGCTINGQFSNSISNFDLIYLKK